MAVPATLLLTCEAGTSIAIPRGVRGARRRSQATAPSGMAPFCISAPRHEPPGPQRTPRQGGGRWPSDGRECGASRRSAPYWPQLSAGPPRRFPRRSRSPPRRRSPRRPRRRKRRRAPTPGACHQRGRRLDVGLLLPRHQAGDRGPHPPALRRARPQARRPGRRPRPPSPSPAASGTASTPAPPGSDSPIAVDPKVWYEFDGYFQLSAVLWEDLTTSALYTAYTSPNDSVRHRPGDRLRGRLQRRQAPRALRPEPGVPRSPSSSTARPTPAPTRASTPRSASLPATPASPWPEPQRLLPFGRLGHLGSGRSPSSRPTSASGWSRPASRSSSSATTSRRSTTATGPRSSAPSASPSRTEP